MNFPIKSHFITVVAPLLEYNEWVTVETDRQTYRQIICLFFNVLKTDQMYQDHRYDFTSEGV